MWIIDYTQEASNYAMDSYPYNEGVLMAIEELALTAAGIPTEGGRQLAADVWLWEVAGHVVLYYRDEAQRKIRISVIKPIE